jgi:hypothetical protein
MAEDSNESISTPSGLVRVLIGDPPAKYAVPGPYELARLLAARHDYSRWVEWADGLDGDPPRDDPRLRRIEKAVPLVEMLARLMVYERIARTGRHLGQAHWPFIALWALSALAAELKRSSRQPQVEFDPESNEFVIKITVGLDSDVEGQCKLARKTAQRKQRELVGYRTRSRGSSRPSRSALIASWNIGLGLDAQEIFRRLLSLTSAWFDGAVPHETEPEWEAFLEWRAKSKQPEALDCTHIRATLRAARRQVAAIERSIGLKPDVFRARRQVS